MKPSCLPIICLCLSGVLTAAEYHVSLAGNDANDGTASRPLRNIAAAAQLAMPGDTVSVHAGTYRERVNPPRGGESDAKRITYQAAPGEQVVITGSEPVNGWQNVAGDTWKVVIPSKSFGDFNPYVDQIRGDWFSPQGRVHHTGCVYLNGDWMIEARNLGEVMAPAGKTPLWFATVDGDDGRYLLNVAWFKAGGGAKIPAGEPAFRYGGKPAACAEGGTCSGFILTGHWLRFDGVDFGAGTDSMEFRTASTTGASLIEVRLDNPAGELLGQCQAGATGDWQKWQSFSAKIKPTSGLRNVCLLFKSPTVDAGNTTLHAQFPGGVNPNEAAVEINWRQTVFYPSKNFINFITVRGFTLQHAATNWAPPSAEQMGVVGTNWSKGWIIEDNRVRYSKCSGVALGKYGDGTDNTNDAGEADPYTACVKRALANGWNKATIGSHVVRNNDISHCEQTGIVGSMGAAFSTVSGNHIHEIHVRNLFGGAEHAGIKLHGAVDTLIRGNYIHHTNGVAGIWLDWMAQGTRVTGNLLHDNGGLGDLFLEVDHGPYLVDNNILLSGKITHQSHGGAYVHNLFAGGINLMAKDGRHTPFMQAHSSEIMGVAQLPDGDDRFYNNIFVGGSGLSSYDRCAAGSVAASGNLYLDNAKACKHESHPAILTATAEAKVEFAAGTAYLTLTLPPLPEGFATSLVTTGTLGQALLTNLGYTDPDGGALKIDSDYFGKPRAAAKPFPGPFEVAGGGRLNLKVWPLEVR
ncbi:MAG: carbohydrate-binding protein [Verrucomicrobiota bacterium]